MNPRGSSFRSAMMLGALAGLGVFDPFAPAPPAENLEVELKNHTEGEPFSNEPVERKRRKDTKRKKRNRKNKRGY